MKISKKISNIFLIITLGFISTFASSSQSNPPSSDKTVIPFSITSPTSKYTPIKIAYKTARLLKNKNTNEETKKIIDKSFENYEKYAETNNHKIKISNLNNFTKTLKLILSQSNEYNGTGLNEFEFKINELYAEITKQDKTLKYSDIEAIEDSSHFKIQLFKTKNPITVSIKESKKNNFNLEFEQTNNNNNNSTSKCEFELAVLNKTIFYKKLDEDINCIKIFLSLNLSLNKHEKISIKKGFPKLKKLEDNEKNLELSINNPSVFSKNGIPYAYIPAKLPNNNYDVQYYNLQDKQKSQNDGSNFIITTTLHANKKTSVQSSNTNWNLLLNINHQEKAEETIVSKDNFIKITNDLQATSNFSNPLVVKYYTQKDNQNISMELLFYKINGELLISKIESSADNSNGNGNSNENENENENINFNFIKNEITDIIKQPQEEIPALQDSPTSWSRTPSTDSNDGSIMKAVLGVVEKHKSQN